MHKTVTGNNFWEALKWKQHKEREGANNCQLAGLLSTVLHNLSHKLLYCLLHLFMLMATHAVQIKAAHE